MCPSGGVLSDESMDALFLEESLAVLTRTPRVLDALLRDLPDAWTLATEGPGTWSPYVVIGHLIHAEHVDWMPRIEIILQHGVARPFDAFNREGQLAEERKTLPALLDEFAACRASSLQRLREINLQTADLERQGMHPGLGVVTMRQLVATWTAHDLAHILQISRVMAKRYKSDVGPWAQYLSVMG